MKLFEWNRAVGPRFSEILNKLRCQQGSTKAAAAAAGDLARPCLGKDMLVVDPSACTVSGGKRSAIRGSRNIELAQAA